MMNATLIEACNRLGKRAPVWTQGAAGNVSLKKNHELLCKAEGVRLDAVKSDKELAGLRLTELRERLSSLYASLANAEEGFEALMKDVLIQEPSMGRAGLEAGAHAVLSEKWVTSFPSLPGLLMAYQCDRDAEALEKWVGKYWRAGIVFIDDPTPGWTLVKTLAEADEGQAAFVVRNQGVFLQHDEDPTGTDGFLEEWSAFEKKFCQHFGYSHVLTLCASGSPIESAREILRENGPMPLPIYLPEAAVQLERLLNVLTPGENATYLLDDDAYHADQDAAELWLASQILMISAPDLDEIPPEISSKLANLKTP